MLTNLSLDSRAVWPMEDVELVRGVLAQSIADSQEPHTRAGGVSMGASRCSRMFKDVQGCSRKMVAEVGVMAETGMCWRFW